MGMNMAGKTVLVTGGSRGIGRSIALELADQGANVVVGYRVNNEAAESVVGTIRSMGQICEAVQADVGDPGDAEWLVSRAIEILGSLDVVICNAGVTSDALLVRMTDEKWDNVIRTNLTGTFNVMRAAARHMLGKRKGRFVLIASVVGLSGNAGQANYAASKAGIIALARSTAKELGSRNITVNVVAPGFVETDMTATLDNNVVSSYLASIPLGRAGVPRDIAKAVAYLASDDAAYITGQVLTVDGGLSL